ncbi:MAG: Unknown protein [uncultured Thiotrichaceae bacterium]|uniref:Uncharacterized protein n=1 Tax=uncultured Thiotrichaceae bacterium TaxID=298394 RepID=A0A6S6T9I5_9GAMM|nr:MAG: Unknown protein [uncultured Thiotrichaceae bacterium]
MGNRFCPERFDRFNLIYLGGVFVLLIASAWLPIKYWSFEREMARNVTQLTGVAGVSFHCNSAFDSIFDNDLGVAGHANPYTKKVVFQVGWCDALMRYIEDPMGANQEAKFSMHMFTHEAMHIRGEMVEQRTDCQALQRDVEAAVILGVPQHIAKDHTEEFYTTVYPKHPYYTNLCAPGKALDEYLIHPPWGES